jgi:class 3 adenylate cyclase
VEVTERAPIDVARGAVERRDWDGAIRAFASADPRDLTPADLEAWGWACRWSMRYDDGLDVLQRAAEAYASDPEATNDAARVLLWLAYLHGQATRMSVAFGLAQRASELLADLEEGPPHAFLSVLLALVPAMDGDDDAALPLLDEAIDRARRTGATDALALALVAAGGAQVRLGDVDPGLARSDEAVALAMTGAASPLAAGSVLCMAIQAWRDAGDLRRAAEWTEATSRWSERERVAPFAGQCRVHRCEIVRLRGDLEAAEREALEGVAALRYGNALAAAWGYNELGLTRLRRGDLAGAGDAFAEALALGIDPQPGRALLALCRGDAHEALRMLEAALADGGLIAGAEVPSALAALVDASLATGDRDRARRAADRLAALADRYGDSAHAVLAREMRATVMLADGEIDAARRELRRALSGWTTQGVPYELARVRRRLADAAIAAGETGDARLELEAARAVCDRIGAALDVAEIDQRLAALAIRPRPGGERAERTFVFCDIVDSTRLCEVLGDDAWDVVLRWFERLVRTTADDHRGEVVKGEGDGCFLAFDDAGRAVAFARRLQEGLAAHRQEQGFAPTVRIGLHRGEAVARDRDWFGTAVNVAARICAAAEPGGILASAASVTDGAALGGEPRAVELRGLGAPVDVVTIRVEP